MMAVIVKVITIIAATSIGADSVGTDAISPTVVCPQSTLVDVYIERIYIPIPTLKLRPACISYCSNHLP